MHSIIYLDCTEHIHFYQGQVKAPSLKLYPCMGLPSQLYTAQENHTMYMYLGPFLS